MRSCWPRLRSLTLSMNAFYIPLRLCRHRSAAIQISAMLSSRSLVSPGLRRPATASGSTRKRAATTVCLPRPNGSVRRAAALNRKTFPGVTNRRSRFPTTRRAGRRVRSGLPATPPTLLAFTTFATISTSGAATGTIRITTRVHPSAIHAARRAASARPRAEDRGGIM